MNGMYDSKRNPTTHYGTKVKSKVRPLRVIDPPYIPCDTRLKVNVVARPLLTPVAQKLCRCEHGVFTSITCVHSRTLPRIEAVCCQS
jgi:hypothetical protein